MVKPEVLKISLCLGMKDASDELAAKRRYLIVKQFEEIDVWRYLDILTDCAYTLILTEGLPEPDIFAMLVRFWCYGSKRVHHGPNARPT
jgi:hypothetical protein